MVSIKDLELNQIIKGSDKTLVLFSAEWCGPCKVLKPNIEKVEEEFQMEYKFVKADVSENEENTKKFGIKNVPTVVLIKNNVEVARFMGVRTSDQIKKFLEENKN